jgi:hypothetical protein
MRHQPRLSEHRACEELDEQASEHHCARDFVADLDHNHPSFFLKCPAASRQGGFI